MLHHILYVAHEKQLEAVRVAMGRLGAEPVDDNPGAHECFMLNHRLLSGLVLRITLTHEIDAITPHLRQNPIDLLIYDERGGLEARAALIKIRDDVKAFANLWGPDFLFPMSRVVAILETDPNDAHRAFELGRIQVRDVLVSPRTTAHVLRWLTRVLSRGIIRDEKAGMALSGGGLEGFLYQVGVLHALGKAFEGRSLRTLDAYTGVSSGSIAASLMAANVPTSEVIAAMHSRSRVLEPMTGAMLFDFAFKGISKRILLESASWAGLDPNKWARKVMRSIPTGLFKGEALREYFKHAIEAFGHPDGFPEEDGPELYIGATDQDSFEHIIFGREPWHDVSISDALRASCALPPFFTPYQLNGRWFVDGQVTKSCNLEMLVERDCRLVLVIDPLKPLATMVPGSVDKRGGVFATIQTIKALVYTRFQQTLRHMTELYPDVDFLVFQPDEESAQLMAGSPMRYRIRTQITSNAYRQTLRQLRERHTVYKAKLGRFGFNLRSKEELMELEQVDDKILEPPA